MIIYIIIFIICQILIEVTKMKRRYLYIYGIVFLILSLFFGKVLNFYRIVPFWDKILHIISGFILYPWGLYLYKKLKGNADNTILKFAFGILFSISCALLWEVWEFAGDSLFHLNSQNNSLFDTMLDMIMGCVGTLVSLFVHK